ncbi:alanine racemase [Streptomyces sp. NPDC002643]
MNRLTLELSEEAVVGNLAAVRRLIDPGTVLMGVVKADAYGHGLVPFSRLLVRHGVRRLAVAHAEEAFRLRDAGINVPVLVLGAVPTGNLPDLIRADLRQTVYAESQARALSRAATVLGRPARVHVEFDTGLCRYGLDPADAGALHRIAALDNLVVEGLYTHLSGTAPEPVDRQLTRFAEACRSATAALGRRPLRHALASPGLAAGLHRRTAMEMVRPGILLYGLGPSHSPSLLPDLPEFRPVLSMTSRIEQLRRVETGTRVGYDGAYTTPRPAVIATVPVGFADGLPKALGGTGRVLVGGMCAPIVGQVGMGHINVDVTEVPRAETGDEVVLLGDRAGHRLGVQDWADAAGTINTEVLVRLAPVAPRTVRQLPYPTEQERCA